MQLNHQLLLVGGKFLYKVRRRHVFVRLMEDFRDQTSEWLVYDTTYVEGFWRESSSTHYKASQPSSGYYLYKLSDHENGINLKKVLLFEAAAFSMFIHRMTFVDKDSHTLRQGYSLLQLWTTARRTAAAVISMHFFCGLSLLQRPSLAIFFYQLLCNWKRLCFQIKLL